MPRQKPPVIEGQIPDPNDTYDLDDNQRLKSANLLFDSNLKIADEYDHYPHCKWAIIEYKSRSLSDAIAQLDWTAKQLVAMSRKVDYAIIIARGIDNPERNLYTKQGNALIYKPKKSPVTIKTGNNIINVAIYDPFEIDVQYKTYRGTLWAFR